MPKRYSWIVSMLLITGVASSAMVGCGHPTVAVFSSPNAKAPDLPGVPFYLKHGVCTQETVWLEPQYTLSLSVAADEEPAVTKTLTLNRAGYLADDTQGLITRLAGLTSGSVDAENAGRCPAVIGEHWDEVARFEKKNWPVSGMDSSADRLRDEAAAGNLVLVSNTAEVTTEVDYSKLYYINSKTPWIGTGSLDAKLATDGTLSEGNAQVQDQTWSTILGTVSSLAGSFTGLGAAQEVGLTGGYGSLGLKPPGAPFTCKTLPGWPTAEKSVKYAYSLATVMYKHDHLDKSGDVGACTVRVGGVTSGSFTVTSTGDAKAAPDKNAILVSGSILLPKADASKDAAPK